MSCFYPLAAIEDKLGLDIKRDPTAGNYKVSFIGFGKYYKTPMKLTANSVFAKRIEIIGKGLKKMLSKIKAPFDIIDAQIIYRPGIGCKGGKFSLAVKVAIRFEKEEDWFDFKNKHRENLYRNEMGED